MVRVPKLTLKEVDRGVWVDGFEVMTVLVFFEEKGGDFILKMRYCLGDEIPSFKFVIFDCR